MTLPLKNFMASLPDQILSKLRPHQVKPVEHLLGVLGRHQSAVDASGTGTGKTWVAAAVIAVLRLPALVVTPFIAQTEWRNVLTAFGDDSAIINYEKLRTGNTAYGTWQHEDAPTEFWKCQCCQRRFSDIRFAEQEPCYTNRRGIHCLEFHKQKAARGRFTFHPGVKFLVADEVHRANGIGTQNAEFLIAAKRQGIKLLGLSATLGESPEKFRALGYTLDLHNLTPGNLRMERGGAISQKPGFYEFCARYGCRRDIQLGPGLHWYVGEEKQRQAMAHIHSQIFPARGVRVRAEDIPGFPERDISAELYDIEKPGLVDRLYADMREALEVLDARATQDVNPDSPLTRILRAHQKVELLKVPVALELSADLLTKGYSVGFFVNYQATVDVLCARLNTSCRVDGTPAGVKYREQNVASFQANRERRIVLNSRAGGICLNLQDLDGGHPRAGLVFPGFDIVTMQQLCGRFQRSGGKSRCLYRVMFAAHSVEENMYRAWRAKSSNLDALNDADLSPFGIPLTKI